jgi:hypothetical protein
VEEPWRGVLEALGYEGDKPLALEDPETRQPIRSLAVPAGRVWRVHQAWRTLRLWSWFADGRIRLDLERSDSGPALGVPPGEGTGGPLPAVPPTARAWIRVPDHAAFQTMTAVLADVGVAIPDEVLGPAGWGGAVGGGPVMAWAEQVAGQPHAWTIGVAAPRGRLPPLAHFLPDLPPTPGSAPLAEGAAPILAYQARAGKPSPAGKIVRAETGPFDVVAFGVDAEALASAIDPAAGPWTPPTPPEPGLRLLASFFLDEPRASKILAALLAPRGFLMALSGGDLSGEVWTDGETLRLEARISRR